MQPWRRRAATIADLPSRLFARMPSRLIAFGAALVCTCAAAQVVLPDGAAVATSSTVRRTWRRGADHTHHIVDPRTSRPAASPWRSVTVVADTCAVANAAATAVIAQGSDGAAWLTTHDLPARLVDHDHQVHLIGGWPQEEAA